MRYLGLAAVAVVMVGCSSTQQATVSTPETNVLPDDFAEMIGLLESDGNYEVINPYGYLGKYQMGECALIDAGVYIPDETGCRSQDWSGAWTGVLGVHSLDDYMTTPDAQEYAFKAFTLANWENIKTRGLHHFVGQTVGGVHVSASGLLAGAHLGGVGGVEAFLLSDGDENRGDANGTRISTYMALFTSINPPAEVSRDLPSTVIGTN